MTTEEEVTGRDRSLGYSERYRDCTATCRSAWLNRGWACPAEGGRACILAAIDDGTPDVTSHRRLVLIVHEASDGFEADVLPVSVTWRVGLL